jgi:AraC-like DNA-binding protein
VKFLPNFAGKDFFERPEMQGIKTVLKEKAPQGIKLQGELRNRAEELMLEMPDLDESDRFISLLQILNHISKSNEYKLLASLNYRNENHKNAHRINLVLDYIMENYDDVLTLEKLANLINMNKNAFCRFFKKGTRKNLFTVINEVRIGKACQHLTETEMNVLQACYSCGFNNISNFNKTFKKITGVSPLQYRKRMKKFDAVQEG